MKELEALSNQILKRIKEEGQEKVLEQEQKIADKLEENRLRMMGYQKAQEQTILQKSQNELERFKQSLANEKRNLILGQKQEFLTDVYQEAIAKMKQWDTPTFQKIVGNILHQFTDKEIRLVPGEQSLHHFSAAFVTELQRQHPGLTIASEAVPHKAGFIVEIGGVDYNYFFDAIVEEIKNDFSPKLASLAFQPNE